MKFVFCFLIYGLSLIPSFAQVKSAPLTHYVFPVFNQGEVLMKTGKSSKAMLNYNSLSEEMVFDNKGQKLAIIDEQLKLIDTVYIKNRKFFRMNDKFVELLYHSNTDLYAEYRCHLEYPGKPDGFGGTSQTTSSRTYSNVMSGMLIYQLSLPEGYKTTPYTYYWLKKNGELHKFKNLKQLTKLYPEKKDLYKSYTKQHEVKFNDQESVAQLVKYLDAN
ncbi:MAG: hypothetical protein OEM04_08205 [Flavobacteriaceae bacterium]|nr:hypothetical protein [Flavobacteriaceae bacterium]